MGTSGISSFENDDALDFLSELDDTEDLALLEQAFQAEEGDGSYLEAPVCARILCAAELLAAGTGSPSASLPPEARAWVSKHSPLPFGSLLPVARSRVARVLAPHSELRELWEENT
jgi:hypothetical protein